MARYELGERIGLGGMAEIFRGKATAGGGFEKPVAIKRILPHLSQDKRFVEALITEAKTLSQLRHRNVVQIYDVGLGDDGQYFLVMEFVDGLDLNRLYESLEQRGRRLPLEVTLYLTGEICEALEHAHHARGENGQPLGLVHRDVSPSNVLLSKSGEIKLTDFGIAKRTEEATGHGGVRGKFAYISPEQAHNKRVDARSDVFSVGILLFELLTGRRLFSGLPDFEALRAVREGRMPRPREIDPGIDAELERILVSALATSPDDRPSSAGELGAQLRTCRYSMVSSVADPAVEIARLIEEYGKQGDARSPSREPSVVRINTVAGFSGGFEVVPEEQPGRSVSGELTGPTHLDEEDETRAVDLDSDFRDKNGRVDLEKILARERREREERGDPDPADAETRVLDFRPGELFPELAAPGEAVHAVSHAESAGPHALGSNGSAGRARLSLPSPRSTPGRNASLPRPLPGPSPRTPAPRTPAPRTPSPRLPPPGGRAGGSPPPSSLHRPGAGATSGPSMGGMGNSMGGSSSAMSPTMGPSAPLAPAHAARSSSSAVPSLQSAQMEDMALAQTVVGGRQGLYTGIGDGREPSPMAPTGPILDSHGSTVRRNAVPIAIGSAFGLAILSFLVVAAFMKKDEGSRAAAGPDAGPTTGAVTATVPSPPGGGTAPASTPSAGTPATGTPATGTPSAAIVDAGVEPSESGTAKGGEPDVIPTPTPPGGKAGRSSARGTDRKPDRASSSKSSATRKKKKKKTTRKTTRSSEKKRGARNR